MIPVNTDTIVNWKYPTKSGVLAFWKGPLSQWWPSKFTVDGVTYNCAEQYMMAQKALIFNDFSTYEKIMMTDSSWIISDVNTFFKNPRAQQQLGRTVSNFNEDIWKRIRKNIVFRGTFAKYTQNSDYRTLLKSTGKNTLVEASPYDKIWGIGLADTDKRVYDSNKWPGLNLLGHVLMEVRDGLCRKH